MPLFTSQRSGNWSDSSANSPWYTGSTPALVPGAGDSVVIASGHTVTVPDGYAAVCGDSPGGSGVVLTINGTLTVGGGASGSLRVKGSAVLSNTQTLTLNAGASWIFDGNGNPGQRYELTADYRSKIFINGTTGSHCQFRTDVSGGGTPAIVKPAGAFGPHCVAEFCDFSYLGDASNVGWYTSLNQNISDSGGDWQFILEDCTIDHCGEFRPWTANNCPNGRVELTRVHATNSLAAYSFNFLVFQTTGFSWFMNGCSLDKAPYFHTFLGFTGTGNYLHEAYSRSGSEVWSGFAGNFLRFPAGSGVTLPVAGNFVGNYLFADGTHANWHGVGVSPDQDVLIDANVFEGPDADQVGDLIMPGIPAGGASRTLTVTRNLTLPNADGESVGKLVSPIGSGTYTLAVEHNTVTATDAVAVGEVGVATYGETWAGRPDLYASVRANVAYTPTGRNAGMIFSRCNQNAVSDAVADSGGSVLLNHNAGNNLVSAPGGIVRDVYGPGYADISPSGGAAMFTSTTGIGSGDVVADPAFVDPARNLGKWGQAVHGTDGGVAAALAVLRDDPSKIADLMGYVREGFRPTNAAYNGATYPGDAMTTDAAGNPLAGTIGAMAYTPAVATTFDLTGPPSGAVNAASSNFTVTPNGPTSGTVTPASTGAGTFSPTSLTWTGDSSPKTFTYIPTSASGSPHFISITSSPALAYSGSPVAYAVPPAGATSFTLTAPTPASGDVARASGDFTVAPVGGDFTGTVTITPSGGGLSTPIVLTFSGSSTPQKFTIAPPLIGVVTLTPTNSGGLANPAAVTYTGLIQLGKVVVRPLTSGPPPYGNGGVQPGDTFTPDLGGYLPFQTGPLSEYMRDVVGDAVDPASDAIMACYQPGAPLGNAGADWTGVKLHVDGGGPDYLLYGMPFTVVDSGTQAFLPVSYENVNGDGGEYYGLESDPGPMPIPLDASIQGVVGACPDEQQGFDTHVIVLDRATKKLYELYKAYQVGGQWHAGSGVIFDLETGGGGYAVGAVSPSSPNLPAAGQLRKATWTSADAAGTCLFPFLVRYDEAVLRGEIKHAIRMTFNGNRTTSRYQYPSRHFAGHANPNSFPFGCRLRMKQSWYDANKNSFTGAARVVVEALRHYGGVNMDIGRDFDTAFVQDSRWDQANLLSLQDIPASAFEVLKIKPGYSLSCSAPKTTVGVPVTVTFSLLPSGDLNTPGFKFYLSDDGGATISNNYAVTNGGVAPPSAPTITYTYTPTTAGTKSLQVIPDAGYGLIKPPDVALVVSDDDLTAGTASATNVGSTGATLNATAATGGTAPYSYRFQRAPDSSGSPGAWADVGPNSTARSRLDLGLSASTTYWLRCVVTDAASGTATSLPVSFATHATRTSTSVANGDWATASTWDNGVPGPGDVAFVRHAVTATADVTIGDGTATTVLTVGGAYAYTGTLTITGAKLTVRGNATFGAGYLGDNPSGSVARVTVTSSAGLPAGIELDGNSGVSPVVQVGQISKLTAIGTAVDRCYVRTKAGSAGEQGSFVGYGTGTAGLQVDLRYCDVTRLGSASVAGFGNCGMTYPGGSFAMDHCVVDNCGTLPNIADCLGDAVFSLTNCDWTNCLNSTDVALSFYTSHAKTTGTRSVSRCTFSGTPHFNYPQDLAIDHNYFGEQLYANHLQPKWASFSNNFVRKTKMEETITSGDVTDSYWLFDPAGDGSHGFSHVSGRESVTFAGNIYQYLGTTAVANPAVVITEAAIAPRVVTVRNNVVLPQLGSASVPLTQAFHTKDDPYGVSTVAEHNTVAVGTGAPVPVYAYANSGPPFEEREGQLSSLRANVFWRVGAAPGAGLTVISNAPSYGPVADAAAAADCDYNALTAFDVSPAGRWTTTDPVAGATACTDGTPYDSPMTGSAPPGAHDVALGVITDAAADGPRFADPTRTVQTWDASLGGPGTVANALAKLKLQHRPAAGGHDANYSTPALMTYVRAGFVPTNPALRNASYPGDPHPDLGAVPFTAAAIATSYALTGPSTGTVNVPSSDFTVTPDAPYAGLVTPSDGGAGGTFVPPSLAWNGTAGPKTFTYAPSSPGPRTITAAANPALANPPAVPFTAKQKRNVKFLPRLRK